MNEKYCDKIVEYIIKFDYKTDVLIHTSISRYTIEDIKGYRLFDSTAVDFSSFFDRLHPMKIQWINNRIREKYGKFTIDEIGYIRIQLHKRMDSIRHNKLMDRLFEELELNE